MNSTRKRVALYLPLGKRRVRWNGLGGAEKRLSYLISHINSEQFETFVVLRIYEGESQAREMLSDYIGVDCTIRTVNNDKEAFRHFRKEKYDYVFYDDSMVLAIPGIIGACLGRSCRILIFVTENYARWSFKKRWHSLIMSFNVFMAMKIDCLYPSSVEILEHKFPTKPVTATPCSLPLLENYIRKSESVSKENTIVFIARMIPEKNPIMLLDAAKMVAETLRQKNYKVLIYGDGPLSGEIISYIRENGLSDIVFFNGVKSAFEVLPMARIFCSLQEFENYPSQSLLEAIASGCYCIATDVGNTGKLVRPAFGVLIQKTPQALAQALQNAITMDDIEINSSALSSREFAIQRFDPRKAILHYENLCKE